MFNETILNVALSKLMTAMQVSATNVQWLSTGYMLVVAVMVSASAFLIYSFTTRQLYLGAMSLFLAGTVWAALSPCFASLLAARMLQATGTGLLVPIMITSALAITPRQKHGFVMGLCTCVILVGPSLGPIVSGVMLKFFRWPSLFILLIPLSLLCMLGGWFYLKNAVEITKPKIDYLSIMLSTGGFAAIVYGMSVIGSGTSVALTLGIFALGILLLGLFCRRQLPLKEPMLDIRAFLIPSFTAGAIMVIVIQMVQFSMNIVLPILFENALHLSSLMSATVLFPAVFVCSVMTIVSGKIYDKIGGGILIPAGIIAMCLFLVALSRILPSTSIVMIALLNTLLYLGISFAWSPLQSDALKQLPLTAHAHGVAIINTFIQLGSALGTPLFVGLMTAGQVSLLGEQQGRVLMLYEGFGYALLVAVVIVASTFVLSWSLRRVAGR